VLRNLCFVSQDEHLYHQNILKDVDPIGNTTPDPDTVFTVIVYKAEDPLVVASSKYNNSFRAIWYSYTSVCT